MATPKNPLRVGSMLPVLITLIACSPERSASVLPTTVRQLELPAGVSFPLTLRANGTRQEGVSGDSNEVRLVTSLRVDDAAEARLCGVIVARSRSMESLPFAWPVDSTMPHLVPQLVNGANVQGFRVLIPGTRAEYRFEGFTTDGSTRVSFRWPVRSDRLVDGNAADQEIETALTPSPKSLDSLLMQLRVRAPEQATRWRGRVLPADSVDGARAVRLVRLLPLYPVGFTPPCGDATFRMSLAAGVDHTVRVLVKRGETITARASTPTGQVTLSFDENSSAGSESGRTPNAAFRATGEGHVTLRLRYNVTESAEPVRQYVLVRLTSDLSP